jgi:hypothetical protein
MLFLSLLQQKQAQIRYLTKVITTTFHLPRVCLVRMYPLMVTISPGLYNVLSVNTTQLYKAI